MANRYARRREMMVNVVRRALRGTLGFLVGGLAAAAGIGLAGALSPRHQLGAIVGAFLIGGALGGARGSSAMSQSRRVLPAVCGALGSAGGGTYFMLLTAGEANSRSSFLAAGAGWAVAGLVIGAGLARRDRSLWLLVGGLTAFGLAGLVSWSLLDVASSWSGSLALASFAALNVGGALFSLAAAAIVR